MNEAQFDVGQYVVYGTNGICLVDRIDMMSFTADAPKEMYYVLRQHKHSETCFFVPFKNEELLSKMREPMRREDIEDILMGLADDNDVKWVTDRRARGDYFKGILNEGVSGHLLNMIRCIYEKKRELARQGKKLSVSDTTTLRSAEKLVEEEFAWALEMDPQEVPAFIRKRLHIQEEE